VIATVILAAGDSTRMGSPKALLTDGSGRTFVARIIRAMAAAGLHDIVIVTGSQDEAIRAAVAADQPPVPPRFARNPDPGRGQLSSLWIGMEAAITPATEAILMTLVDVPMLLPSTVQAVVEAWRETRPPIVRPRVGGRFGHPVLFDRVVFDELRHAPLDRGARTVVHARGAAVLNIAVEDAGCIADIDTPADYQRVANIPNALKAPNAPKAPNDRVP
jgi:CTP:molybdopterin cytidylyltransferase MocA